MAAKKKWSGKVKTKWHSPPGLFTESAEKIAKTVAENSKNLKQTISRITFFGNRAGVNLDASGRARLERAKKIARSYFPEAKGAKKRVKWTPKPARAPKKKATSRKKAVHKKTSPTKKTVHHAAKAAHRAKAARADARRVKNVAKSIQSSLKKTYDYPAAAKPLGPLPGAPYFFSIIERYPLHWKRSRKFYRPQGKTLIRSLGIAPIAELGIGRFHRWIVEVNGRRAHVAQRA